MTRAQWRRFVDNPERFPVPLSFAMRMCLFISVMFVVITAAVASFYGRMVDAPPMLQGLFGTSLVMLLTISTYGVAYRNTLNAVRKCTQGDVTIEEGKEFTSYHRGRTEQEWYDFVENLEAQRVRYLMAHTLQRKVTVLKQHRLNWSRCVVCGEVRCKHLFND